MAAGAMEIKVEETGMEASLEEAMVGNLVVPTFFFYLWGGQLTLFSLILNFRLQGMDSNSKEVTTQWHITSNSRQHMHSNSPRTLCCLFKLT